MALTRIDGSVLANTGVTSGNYGGSTQIPVLNIDGQGRIVSASNAAVSSTITLAGTSGTGSVSGGGTLTFAGSNGFTITVSSSTATFGDPQNLQSTSATTQFASLGIGTAASGVIGEIRAANNITAYYSSDARLKENIINISNPLSKVKSLNGVEFDWTDKYLEEHGGEDGYFLRKHDIGIIAQELEKVLPEIVADRPDGYKAVKYDRIVALLIEAIKELSEEVERLKESK